MSDADRFRGLEFLPEECTIDVNPFDRTLLERWHGPALEVLLNPLGNALEAPVVRIIASN